MSEQEIRPIWARQDGEPGAWFARFLIYRGCKPASGRLHDAYVSCMAQAGKSPRKPSQSVDVPGAWKEKADQWQWKKRAEAYDAMLQAEAEERAKALRDLEAAEIEKIMTSGYALIHNRVQGLDQMARDIRESMIDPETKEINPKWVYPDKIREYRGCLDDIAKELGARVKKTELAGKDGGPIEYSVDWGGGVIEDSDDDGGKEQ